mgnify:CR=1 FL=1
MKKSMVRLMAFAAVAVVSSCATVQGPPSTVPAPLPEPVLVQSGPVFAYDTGSGVLTAIGGPDTVLHEVLLDHVAVRVRTPPGWVSSYAGYGAWFQQDYGSARFVVYPVDDHAVAFRDVWRDRDLHDPAVRVGPVQSFDSERHPMLYTYERIDDGRRGIVYAMLSDPSRPGSGILVHGIWPPDQDRGLRPIIVAAANGAILASR